MKKRPRHFLSADNIDHNGEIFDYITELHGYLWRFIRAVKPGASGSIDDLIDWAIKKLDTQRGEVASVPEVKALVDACRAFVEAWEKSHQLEKTDVALRMAKSALEPFTPPASPTPERTGE